MGRLALMAPTAWLIQPYASLVQWATTARMEISLIAQQASSAQLVHHLKAHVHLDLFVLPQT